MATKINGDALYSIYALENPSVVGADGRIRHRKLAKSISRERFISIASHTKSDKVLTSDITREEAKTQMINNVWGSVGFIEYFVLRAIIIWIIEKILDYYFNKR